MFVYKIQSGTFLFTMRDINISARIKLIRLMNIAENPKITDNSINGCGK